MPLSFQGKQAVVLVAAATVALSSGTNYVFSSWATQLASRLHLSSSSTNAVGAMGNAGVYLSGPALGILVDKHGPRLALIIAAVSLFVGYSAIRLVYDGGEDGLYSTVGLLGLCLASMATGIGSSAGLSAAVNGVSKSFGKRRGSAIAAVVSCFGLSAFAYSSISHAHFIAEQADHTSSFLLLLSLGCGASQLLGVFFVRPLNVPQRPDGGYEAIEDPDSPPQVISRSATSSPALSHVEFRLSSPVELEEERIDDDGHLRAVRSRSRSRSKERDLCKDIDVSGWALMRTSDFWWMWAFLGLCSGVGLMYINNLGSIVATLALGEEPHKIAASQALLVSTLSISNCLGRLIVGGLSDWFVHDCPETMRFARIWFYVPIAGVFVLSQVMAGAATTLEALPLPTILTGLAYGGLFASSPVVCLERFGMRSFAANNGWLTLAPSVFGNLANLAFGVIYDSHVDRSHPSAAPVDQRAGALLRRAGGGAVEHICVVGRDCYSSAFRLTQVLSLAAVVVGVVLARRRTMQGSG